MSLQGVMDGVYLMTGYRMVGLTAWMGQTRPLSQWTARWADSCNQWPLLSLSLIIIIIIIIIPGDDLPAWLCPVCGGCVVSIVPLSGVPDWSHQTLCRGRHGAGRVQRLYSRISQSSIIYQFIVFLWKPYFVWCETNWQTSQSWYLIKTMEYNMVLILGVSRLSLSSYPQISMFTVHRQTGRVACGSILGQKFNLLHILWSVYTVLKYISGWAIINHQLTWDLPCVLVYDIFVVVWELSHPSGDAAQLLPEPDTLACHSLMKMVIIYYYKSTVSMCVCVRVST